MTLKVKRLIRLFHHYKYDGGDDRIRDGGDDMYDYGNLVCNLPVEIIYKLLILFPDTFES